MPVLPIIDLLIFLGWTTLAAGGVLKAIHLATSYRPTLVGLTPADVMMVALCFLLLALTLSARSLVRQAEARSASNRLPRAGGGFDVAPGMDPRERADEAAHTAAHDEARFAARAADAGRS